MKMKLNEKGKELYDIWYKNYCKENDAMGGNSAEGDFVDGWSIIDNCFYVKNITDECGVLIFGYEERAIEVVDEWLADGLDEDMGGNLNCKLSDVRNELFKYFE